MNGFLLGTLCGTWAGAGATFAWAKAHFDTGPRAERRHPSGDGRNFVDAYYEEQQQRRELRSSHGNPDHICGRLCELGIYTIADLKKEQEAARGRDDDHDDGSGNDQGH